MTDRITFTENDTGCYLDNHRGHYITRDMIELAVSWGFIIGTFEKFAVAVYEDYDGDENFPHEGLTELADDALNWLNCGDNEGKDRPIKFQNNPPKIPQGYSWQWNDGDFGLYADVIFAVYDADAGKLLVQDLDTKEAREYLTNAGVQGQHIERFLAQSGDDIPLQIGYFTVEANHPA